MISTLKNSLFDEHLHFTILETTVSNLKTGKKMSTFVFAMNKRLYIIHTMISDILSVSFTSD